MEAGFGIPGNTRNEDSFGPRGSPTHHFIKVSCPSQMNITRGCWIIQALWSCVWNVSSRTHFDNCTRYPVSRAKSLVTFPSAGDCDSTADTQWFLDSFIASYINWNYCTVYDPPYWDAPTQYIIVSKWRFFLWNPLLEMKASLMANVNCKWEQVILNIHIFLEPQMTSDLFLGQTIHEVTSIKLREANSSSHWQVTRAPQNWGGKTWCEDVPK